jgi:transcriptional regulator with XRE-family HTH domain
MSESSPDLDAQLESIAARVRRWREEAGLTIQGLAERSGVAASTIQKVETNQMVPSIAVLLKIATGLDRLPSELIREEAPELDVSVLRAGDRPSLGDPKRTVLDRLTGDVAEPALEVWRVAIPPGRGLQPDSLRYDGDEWGLCEAGEPTYQIGEREVRLAPGDSIHLKASIPHSFRNDGELPARLLVVGTVPQILREAFHAHAADRGKHG